VGVVLIASEHDRANAADRTIVPKVVQVLEMTWRLTSLRKAASPAMFHVTMMS
jgi:hypothetical protein